MTEKQQWDLFLDGDEQALSDIYLKYHKDLVCYGMKLIRDIEIVKDSIQELFLKLWRNKQTLSATDKIKPYLFRALRNHIEDNREIFERYTFIRPDADFGIELSAEDFIISQQVSAETREKIIGVLGRISPRQREAIYLRYFEDLEILHIAQIMNMNEQSVRNILYRAIQTLRELMLFEGFLVLLGNVIM